MQARIALYVHPGSAADDGDGRRPTATLAHLTAWYPAGPTAAYSGLQVSSMLWA